MLRVDRPTTTTKYGQVGAADAYGRIQSVWRKLDVSTSLETRTTWDATYPTEPASITANYGALQSTPARTTTYTYVTSTLGLVEKVVEPLTATDDRWTEYTYNANNDVTQEEVSLEGSDDEAERTITKYCYETQDVDCDTAEDGLTMVSRIDRFDDGETPTVDTNVRTDFAYDAYGQLTSDDPAGQPRGSPGPYDDKGNLTTEIVNYGNGTITPGTTDSDPVAGGARTDLTTAHTYDTAGNLVSTADPRRAIANTTTTYVVDGFGRSVTDGWGTADTGGSWTGTTADHDVGSGIGTIAIGAGVGPRRQPDRGVGPRRGVPDACPRQPHGDRRRRLCSSQLRRQDGSNFYQARLTYSPTGVLKISARKTAAGTPTVLGSEYTTLAPTTSDWYWFRGQVSGTTTVSFKLRVWKDGTTEPGNWGVEASDGSPPAGLQGTGHFGIHFNSSGSYSGTSPITGSFDGLALTSVGGVGLAADDFVTRTTYDPLDQAITTSTPTTPGLAGAAETVTTTYDELGACDTQPTSPAWPRRCCLTAPVAP